MSYVEDQAAFVEALRQRGLRATPQRVVLHRIVQELRGHVTAEELLAAAARELPNVSLPTIYNALALLEQMGTVRRVSSLGGTAIYDPVLTPHHHAVCRVCGRVWDLDADVDDGNALAAARALGFADGRAQLTVQGLCADCAAQAPASG
jgi:Fe2+ or Zn2+ uptake regulation protein